MTNSDGVLPPRTRRITVIAQDPSVRRGRRIVTGQVAIPQEDLQAGPWGHRVQVVDYDASLDRYREPEAIACERTIRSRARTPTG